MAVARKRAKKDKTKFDLKTAVEWVKSLFLEPKNSWIIGLVLFCAELVVNLLVVWKIRYTEIDWQAYMQEVEGVINGTYNYYELKGDTGPLVYPAGFVYIFGGLYYLTNKGTEIIMAQYIFVALYLLSLVVIFTIYQKTAKVPPYAFFFMCCGSYRIHSIYILRLFNDPVAMFFLYIAVLCFVCKQWNVGCLFFSLGVSIKMNILLFAPGLLLVLLMTFGVWCSIPRLAICAIIQVILGLPFLLHHPMAYLIMSFNLGRQFLFQWTVNWRFLPEWVFLNRYFHIFLLVLHLGVLWCFYQYIWTRKSDSVRTFFKWPFVEEQLPSDNIL
ncbi:Dol-P-Man:Man(5)GlcNAc(2)-PP-Dol alpha-1,3-mannosyltransferase [Exaiptasia diaphana]|nr:Dol-P-Man:Man(5)GlcNAc(2)-PP-Dol alpha-1,3-mannosyltransferase [Exaiptasia diaphana]